jgi:arylsulfatase A-like enzyme
MDLPTVVLVVLDTARFDRVGCYGYARPTTPTLDSLAREGLRVETMVSNAPWTLPSHGSLFTGLYPTQHGSQWRTGPKLRPSVEVTMAEWLRGLGYETWCVTNNGMISARTGLSRGFDRYVFRLDLERGFPRIARRVEKVLLGGDSGGRIVNRWMRRELPRARRPLFLFVNYLECHWSYAPPPRFAKRVGGPTYGWIDGLRYRAGVASHAGAWEAVGRAEARDLEVLSTYYDGELANADHHLEELLAILSATGHVRGDGRAIVIVTSDHGEHLGEHGLADHHASLDELMCRVPFVAWGPGVVRPGVRTSLAEFVDVLPALARLLGSEPPAAYLEGRRTDLFGTGVDGHAFAFAEWRSWSDGERARLARRNPSYRGFEALARDLLSVRDARFKLVRGSDGRSELFDLEADPAESRDVSSEHPEVVRALGEQIEGRTAEWAAWEGERAEMSPKELREIERRLSDLGYI